LLPLNYVATIFYEFEFDPDKSAKNARERGLPFQLAAELEWQRAVVFVDDRFIYGEERLIAFAPLRGRLYAVYYVLRRTGPPDHQLQKGQQTR
jgi:uncharacterized DUF497 family protein